jgi:hypothetical protein
MGLRRRVTGAFFGGGVLKWVLGIIGAHFAPFFFCRCAEFLWRGTWRFCRTRSRH